MKLLPQTQSTLIPQLLIVGSNKHNFLLGKNLWFLISTQRGLVINLATLWKTIYVDAVLWTSLSVIQEISHNVNYILRAYNISDWQSEPYHQNQNPAKWRYRIIKAWTNTIMNRTGAPANCWLLILQYVCYILNNISAASLGGQDSLQV